MKIVKFSVGTALVAALTVGILLMPRAAVATGVTKVMKAFQDATKYHVKSFEVVGSKRTLLSETWVDGDKKRIEVYGPDGKPLPDSLAYSAIEQKIEERMQGLTAAELTDANVLSKVIQDTVAGTGVNGKVETSTTIIVNGQEVKELPKEIKDQLGSATLDGNTLMVGGAADVAYLRVLLKQASLWTIQPGQTYKGKIVDKYTLKGYPGLSLLVDPTTSLPVLMRTSVDGFAIGPMVVEDEFDYNSVQPSVKKLSLNRQALVRSLLHQPMNSGAWADPIERPQIDNALTPNAPTPCPWRS